jgi:hypothetical protein
MSGTSMVAAGVGATATAGAADAIGAAKSAAAALNAKPMEIARIRVVMTSFLREVFEMNAGSSNLFAMQNESTDSTKHFVLDTKLLGSPTRYRSDLTF